MSKRGKKPVLGGEHQALALKLREAGVKPPSFKDYCRTPPAVRDVLRKLLEKPNCRDPRLPENFTIIGEWVSCLILPDGKTVQVNGKGLRVKEFGDEDANS